MDSKFLITADTIVPKFPKFKQGDYVQKKSGSFWQGQVVGFYSTDQTPVGYCVQLVLPGSDNASDPMPVQIYPEQALEEWLWS